MELRLEELVAATTQDELAAEAATAQVANTTTKVAGFTRIADHPVQHLDDLLQWNWAKAAVTPIQQAA